MGEFRMPSLGADMTEGTLLEWQVRPGDEVHRGDIIAVVDTDKAAIDVECFEDGVLDEILVTPGTKVAVGTPLARIGGGSQPERPAAPVATPAPAPPPAPLVESPLVRRLAHDRGVDLAGVHGTGRDGLVTRSDVDAAAPRSRVPAASVVTAPVVPSHQGARRASPYARRRAAEIGIDLDTVTGTGPAGAVTAADLDQPLPAVRVAEPANDRAASMRHAIGALMARSKREVPHYYLSTTIDMTASMDWLRSVNAARPVTARLVPAALLLKASAVALHKVPQLNAWWVDDQLQVHEHVHLGVAVSLRPNGLVAPAILDADTLDLDALMARLTDLVTRARTGRLRGREMSDGTITVTNLGDNGAEAVFGVIYPPQVALVGVGRVVERPIARHGLLGVAPTVTVTLSADHRVTDGHDGSRYLTAIDDLLQRPESL